MKKILSLIALITTAKASVAQEALDALRFSYLQPVHSARIQAIGGANASLGGDLSATFINPAGLAQYKTNEVVVAPGFFLNRPKITYNNTEFKDSRNHLHLATTGVVLSRGSFYKNSPVRNTTISFAVQQQANYNSNFSYGGRNAISSFSEKWVEELIARNATSFNQALQNFPGGASLAVENYLIDSIRSPQGQLIGYRTNANVLRMPLDQRFTYETRGGMYDAAFGMAWNRNEKIFYGFSIGIPIVNFNRLSIVEESDASGNRDNDFESFQLREQFSTRGAGLNAKFGVIAKPTSQLRLGLAFHTPSVLALTDRTDATLTTQVENYAKRITGDNNRASSFSLSTRDITNGAPYSYMYTLTTPWRLLGSASFVLNEVKDVSKQRGFITADIELVNYKAASFSSASEVPSQEERAYFKGINDDIDQLFRMAWNARLGGELKFNTLMVRGGFAYFGNPYQQDIFPDDASRGDRMVFSGGLGYRHRGIFIDLTYAHTLGRDIHIPYMLFDSGYPLVNNRFTNGQVATSIGFKF